MDTIFFDANILENINYFYNNNFIVANIFIIIFSLIIGSFLNVIIYRLPIVIFNEWREDCYEFLNTKKKDRVIDKKTKKITLFSPNRSFCPECNNKIKYYDNIPVISFILLKSKCRHCKTPISWRYPFIELLAAFASVLVFIQYNINSLSLAILFLTYLLIIIACIDFENLIIPDSLSYIGLWLGLIINSSIFDINNITYASDAILGAIVGYLILWILYWVFKLTTGKEGFGHGDFKLTALFGAWLGLSAIFPILIIASITGIIFSVIAYYRGIRGLDKPFPFGPYLVFAGWIMLLYKDYLPINIISLI